MSPTKSSQSTSESESESSMIGEHTSSQSRKRVKRLPSKGVETSSDEKDSVDESYSSDDEEGEFLFFDVSLINALLTFDF